MRSLPKMLRTGFAAPTGGWRRFLTATALCCAADLLFVLVVRS
ncbi:hypothetical protein [Sphingomonas phyllosphaerae]|nr:hypothetical protein [Sphingomonas phyllosphaerae]